MVSHTSVNELLKGVQQLSAEDFDLFFKKVSSLRSKKSEKNLTLNEQSLLHQIKNVVPADFKKQFFKLVEKRDANALSEAEYAELLRLTDQYEHYDLIRLRLMMELANSRGMSLPELVKKFKLHPSENA